MRQLVPFSRYCHICALLLFFLKSFFFKVKYQNCFTYNYNRNYSLFVHFAVARITVYSLTVSENVGSVTIPFNRTGGDLSTNSRIQVQTRSVQGKLNIVCLKERVIKKKHVHTSITQKICPPFCYLLATIYSSQIFVIDFNFMSLCAYLQELYTKC